MTSELLDIKRTHQWSIVTKLPVWILFFEFLHRLRLNLNTGMLCSIQYFHDVVGLNTWVCECGKLSVVFKILTWNSINKNIKDWSECNAQQWKMGNLENLYRVNLELKAKRSDYEWYMNVGYDADIYWVLLTINVWLRPSILVVYSVSDRW